MMKITEESGTHKQWYEEATKQTQKSLPEFIRKLIKDYGHDYGTICHACAAAALGAAHAVNHSPTGGITGFQAGAVMWEFIMHWQGWDGPAMLRRGEDLLYPQYESKFRTISEDTHKWLQEEAQKHLLKDGETAHEAVRAHWEFIAAGGVPFGLSVEKEGA